MAALPDVAGYLADFQKRFDAVSDSGDTKRLAAEFYHPHAVLVQRGTKCWYGTEGIATAYEDFKKVLGDQKFELRHDTVGQTTDGEYLYLKGTYWASGKPDEKKPFEQVFKRSGEGHYVIYHDEFVG